MSHNSPPSTTNKVGVMQVGSGLSVNNGVVSASLGLLNYGFFTDGTQANPVANAVNLVTLSGTGPANGISISGGNSIVVVNAGTYTKMFTILVSKTSGGTSDVSFWLRYNGTNVVGSRQDLELTNTLSTIFTSGNFSLNMSAGSNIQMCWSSSDTTVSLLALPAAVTPTRPTGSSVKITLTRIS